MRRLSYSLLLLAAVPLAALSETTVSINGKELLYQGELTGEANEKVFELYNQQHDKPSTLTITSTGGAVHLGLELGEWVYKHNLNVKVYDLCFSSCANYVFPAGRKKLLSEGAVVGFHGGPTSETFDTSAIDAALQSAPEQDREKLRESFEASFKAYIEMNIQREAEFYRKLGVSPKLNTLGQSAPYEELRQSYQGWVYSPEDMRTLGLTNIEIINASRSAEQARKARVFLLQLAPQSTLMLPVGLPVLDEAAHD